MSFLRNNQSRYAAIKYPVIQKQTPFLELPKIQNNVYLLGRLREGRVPVKLKITYFAWLTHKLVSGVTPNQLCYL